MAHPQPTPALCGPSPSLCPNILRHLAISHHISLYLLTAGPSPSYPSRYLLTPISLLLSPHCRSFAFMALSYLLAWHDDPQLDALKIRAGLAPPHPMVVQGIRGHGGVVTHTLPGTSVRQGRWCFSSYMSAVQALPTASYTFTHLPTPLSYMSAVHALRIRTYHNDEHDKNIHTSLPEVSLSHPLHPLTPSHTYL